MSNGVGLWPWRLIHPGPSSWGDCDPGAATGQTEYPSPAVGGIHLVHTYPHQISVLLSQRGEQDEAVDVRVSTVSVCLCHQYV